jgi:CelD/BcsL family acetyltransferase involved in cellulose biosynthesis
VVNLPKSWEEYLERFSSKSRYNLRRERRLLEEGGEVRFRWTRDAAEFRALWPTLVDLHQRRWRAEGKPGCFDSPQFTAFHERLGGEWAADGRARLAVLSINGKPVTMRYQFVHDGVVYDYQSGQDPDFKAQLSPGNVLVGYCIEAAIAEGLKVYDFLKGLRPYKQSWSKEVRHQLTLRLVRPGLREWARAGMERAVGWAKRWRRVRPATSASQGAVHGGQ